MTITVKTAAEKEPLSIPDARRVVRMEPDDDSRDLELAWMIGASRAAVEARTRRCLIERTLTLTVSDFDSDVLLPTSPVQSIKEARFMRAAQDGEVISADQFRLSLYGDPKRVTFSSGAIAAAKSANAIALEIDLVAGYGQQTEDVPADLRQAVMFLVAHFDANAEAAMMGDQIQEIPFGVSYLIEPYRILV